MSETYVTMKIREAMAQAQGSRAQAQRILMAWALADEQLMRGLCKPFLKGITGAAIERAYRGGPTVPAMAPAAAVPSGGTSRRAPAPQRLTQAQLDAIVARMGGTRLANQPPILNGAPPPKSEGTVKQAASVKALAAAFHRKKF
ncbi:MULTISPECIES: hypothetical protein [Nitrospirillum]|uniref:Uncharacterized protein n=1 Tax=Nitrospirillum amazonense TaxID=28077 RepID=A0A560GA33_9PROT|nr:hypothetical protein [Nitrospirillum amazonense]MEC4591249.1 hypothetical protein [Nitrospirillum amazonense]TWB30763.1 hypothetical protein FBZ88_102328 [Nitrospirillum amazonense]